MTQRTMPLAVVTTGTEKSGPLQESTPIPGLSPEPFAPEETPAPEAHAAEMRLPVRIVVVVVVVLIVRLRRNINGLSLLAINDN